jgi:AbrB family looped-hinge helix DNA binding protein
MDEIIKIGEQNRITIPKNLREQAAIGEGDYALLTLHKVQFREVEEQK